MGVNSSKSKRDSRSERKASQSKVGKKNSVTGKDSVLMTALEKAESATSKESVGPGTSMSAEDTFRTAAPGRRDTTRAWTESEEPRTVEKGRSGTVKVERQLFDASQQRTNLGQLEIFDVEPEAEMTPCARSGHREIVATCTATGDVADRKSNDDVTTAADEYAGEKRGSVMPLPSPPEIADVRNKGRVSTGGVMTTGILNLPNEVFHGDGLPDVECVVRGNERKTSILESALLARCQSWKAVEREKPYGNASQNGNKDVDGTKSDMQRSFPGSYACSYGCSYSPACSGLVGDFLLRLTTDTGDFVGTGLADGIHFESDGSSCAVKDCALVLTGSGVSDPAAVEVQPPVAAQRLHPIADTLREQLAKEPRDKTMDHAAWLALENKIQQSTREEANGRGSDGAAGALAEMLAEKMTEQITEKVMEEIREKVMEEIEHRCAGDVVERLTEQMVGQLNEINQMQTPHPKVCPAEDAPAQKLEEAGVSERMEEAEGGQGTVEPDETLTEEAAIEDVPDSPEELDGINSWHRNDAMPDCTPHPPTILSSSGQTYGAEAGLHGDGLRGNDSLEYATSGMEKSEKVVEGIHDDGYHGDTVLAPGSGEQYPEVVAGVHGDSIYSQATAEHNAADGMALLMDEDKTGHSTRQQKGHDRRRMRSTSANVRDDVLDGSADPCPDCTATGSGSKIETTWSDSEVTGNDGEVAWSDAWVTWSGLQVTQKNGGGRGKKKRGGKTKTDPTIPSRDLPLP